MNRICTALLAVVAAWCLPGTSFAGNVGYNVGCFGGSPATLITAAGHTPVLVTTYNATTLASLDALMVETCDNYVDNAAINTKVAAGMTLIVHDWLFGSRTLPGAPAINTVFSPGTDLDVPAASPIITGPGGTLTNTSLDFGNSSNHGYTTVASLPANSTVLVTTPDPSRAVTFSYRYGQGRVIFAAIPLSAYLPGGMISGGPVAPGMRTYTTNLVAWGTVPEFVSCAAEGYSGTKLTLCRQVCEMHYPTTTLNALIKTWMALYHQDPPCAH